MHGICVVCRVLPLPVLLFSSAAAACASSADVGWCYHSIVWCYCFHDYSSTYTTFHCYFSLLLLLLSMLSDHMIDNRFTHAHYLPSVNWLNTSYSICFGIRNLIQIHYRIMPLISRMIGD